MGQCGGIEAAGLTHIVELSCRNMHTLTYGGLALGRIYHTQMHECSHVTCANLRDQFGTAQMCFYMQ